MNKRFIYLILLCIFGTAAIYSFLHKGVKSPVKAAINIKETERRCGDFWSTFPASFAEKYNPALRDKTIVKNWYHGADWGYGPIQHLITLPLTSLTSIRTVSMIWLGVNYLFLAGAIFFALKIFGDAPFMIKALILFIWLCFWPLYPAIEENVIEVFELFLIVASLYLMLRGKDIRAGVLLGIASMAKFLPVLFLPYLLMKRRLKAFFAMLAAIILIAIGTQFTLGWQNNEMLKRFFTEIRQDKYDYTYWRSQTLPSAIERIFSTSDYSAAQIHYPKMAKPGLVKILVKVTVAVLFICTFLILFRNRKGGDLRIEFGIVSILMFLASTHGEHYYLIFSLTGYSAAVYFLWRRKNLFGTAILAISYLLSGYLVQIREFDIILLPRYTDINREIFFHFLSFPVYGIIMLFVLLVMIYFRWNPNGKMD